MYWFAYLTTAIELIIFLVMPKQLSKQEIYLTWGILSSITLNVDLVFGLVVWDLFDYGPSGQIQLKDLFFEAMISPLMGIIFLNFMPKVSKTFVKYLIFWVAFSTIFEWLANKSHYLTYKGWKLWYSTIAYTIIFLYLRWHLFFIRKKTIT